MEVQNGNESRKIVRKVQGPYNNTNTKQHQNENGEQKNCEYIALMDGKIPPSAGLSSSSAVVVSLQSVSNVLL